MPSVRNSLAAWRWGISNIPVASEYPVCALLSARSAVLKQSLRGLLGPCAGAHKAPLGGLGALGDDIDNAIDGIGSPHRSSRAANHLNAVDVFQWHMLLVPIDARAKRGIDAAAVDQDQHFISVAVREAANADRPNVGIDLCNVDPRDHAQQGGNVSGAGAPNVFLRDHENCGSCLGQFLLLLGYRRNLDIHEIFQAGLCKVVGRRALSGAPRDAGAQYDRNSQSHPPPGAT